jgi:hypothetical protein
MMRPPDGWKIMNLSSGVKLGSKRSSRSFGAELFLGKVLGAEGFLLHRRRGRGRHEGNQGRLASGQQGRQRQQQHVLPEGQAQALLDDRSVGKDFQAHPHGPALHRGLVAVAAVKLQLLAAVHRHQHSVRSLGCFRVLVVQQDHVRLAADE